MIRVHQLFSSCLGIGYIKGGGTITAIICCGAWWLVQGDGRFQPIMIAVTVAITLLGTWSATMVEPGWGKDSSRVVIDEAAGMYISLLFVPVTVPYLLAGLVLFRFFDIVKPLYIRRAEALPAGWGVMMDDVLAGIYTNILLQAAIHFNVW
ncbi:MAG: phosphatidylglycerophosphatase [Sediminibacterium sp.]|nr:phosphatidylglycerophosphatase [Sediminibacterium sp.]